MKNKLCLIFMATFVFLIQMISCGWAAECPTYFGNGAVDYKKSLSQSDAGKGVTISVIDVDKKWDDTEWENINTDVFVYADNKTVDNNGEIFAEFIVDKSGVYDVILGIDGYEENINDKFEVIIESQAKEAIEKIKEDGLTEDELDEILIQYKNELGLTSENFDDVADSLAQIVFNSKGSLTSDTQSNVKFMKKALKAAEFNSEKISSIVGIEDLIGIKGSDFEKWNKESFDADIVARLSGKKFKSVSEFDKAVKEAVLLERIENPNGNADIVNIIAENYQDMGLDSGTVSLNVAGKIAGGEYETYQELENKIAKIKSSDSGSSGGGGSSKGNSFGGGSSGVIVASGTEMNNADATNAKNEQKRFCDMQGYEWAEYAVESLALEGVINGKDAGVFAPGDYVTREEFAKMVVGLFNFNVVSEEFNFTDVSKDSWYYEYVRRAHGSRVVNGISENLFGSGQNILRQDAIVMMHNALKYINSAEKGNIAIDFNDEEEIASYAEEAVEILVSNGIVKGYDTGDLLPRDCITRAEAAMLIYNCMIKFNL